MTPRDEHANLLDAIAYVQSEWIDCEPGESDWALSQVVNAARAYLKLLTDHSALRRALVEARLTFPANEQLQQIIDRALPATESAQPEDHPQQFVCVHGYRGYCHETKQAAYLCGGESAQPEEATERRAWSQMREEAIESMVRADEDSTGVQTPEYHRAFAFGLRRAMRILDDVESAQPEGEEAVKRCYVCGESKPLDDFHRNRGNKDGRQGYCKGCQAKLVAEVRELREALKPFADAGKRLVCEGDRGYRNGTFDDSRESYRFRVGDVLRAYEVSRHPRTSFRPQRPSMSVEQGSYEEVVEAAQAYVDVYGLHGPSPTSRRLKDALAAFPASTPTRSSEAPAEEEIQ